MIKVKDLDQELDSDPKHCSLMVNVDLERFLIMGEVSVISRPLLAILNTDKFFTSSSTVWFQDLRKTLFKGTLSRDVRPSFYLPFS
jgi:hypothetical protein